MNEGKDEGRGGGTLKEGEGRKRIRKEGGRGKA